MIRRSYERISKDREKQQLEKQKIHAEDSKLRLIRAVEKKFKTCFIGSIDSVEHYFGVLWDKDSKSKQKTDFQIKVYKQWQKLRTEMLDKGNAQLRAMLKELEEYDVNYFGHKFWINGEDECKK